MVPLASDPPFDETGTPPQSRGFLGVWGPGIWRGDPAGAKLLLIVTGVDAEGRARGVIARSYPISWRPFTAPLADGQLKIHLEQLRSAGSVPTVGLGAAPEEDWQFDLLAGPALHGTRNGGRSTIELTRMQ